MSAIREEIVNISLNISRALIDTSIQNNLQKQQEFEVQTILTDNSLTEDEKTYAIRRLNKIYDRDKVLFNEGTKRICENCNQECLATLYCEYCVRNYLKANFSNWTSGNNNIDNLIQNCQLKTLTPEKIIEWIPYNKFQNIKYLTKGGYSEIYSADWIDGRYYKWDSDKRQLERFGEHEVILKRLENVENANHSWLEEAKSHLTISNKWPDIVKCFGLTQDPSNGDYMLVMYVMDVDLREYLQQNHNQLTWKKRIQFAYNIIDALDSIHKENAIHRDLHSGNILFEQFSLRFFISDLGFCGPADKSPKSIYGNLPYIAPEVIAGKQTTFKSDIYSFAMLMWEISSGQPPFMNNENDYDLAMNIINGMRPKIVSGTPLEYESLMKQCWDADPLKRPDASTLLNKIDEINRLYHISNELTQPKTNINSIVNKHNLNYTSSRLFTTFHSKSYYDNFHILDNVDNSNNIDNSVDKLNNQKNDHSSKKRSGIFKDSQKDYNNKETMQHDDDKVVPDNPGLHSGLTANMENLQMKNDPQNDYNNKEMLQLYSYIDDDKEVHNNPNLHSEEQDELEIPEANYYLGNF
ncbi:kinase-like domain-containing protein [Glomus cerebriforme]|uniref:Kinase-like domain-containing protein n=1 Tax=Glomus cerebriforme TaxID=658196 RepID=A0A397T0D4_9GLOM|nr:kinase-like domain-containing protein [Glomus cerebriforme]